jgi:preprotein translocase subunit YajC
VKNLGAFLPLILIVLVFWVLVIRPQRKRQQQLTQTQKGLEIGTEVMLGSGIFGTVVSVADETLRVEVAPGTTIKVARQAVVRVVTPQPEAQPDAQPDIRRDEPEGSAADEGSVDLTKGQQDRPDQPGKQDQ